MTNDRNMGNIETANQSNLVSAHGIFNSIKYNYRKKYTTTEPYEKIITVSIRV